MKVWIAGRALDVSGRQWELRGVYSCEASAIRRCVLAERDFIAPMEIDQDTPETTEHFPGCKYPLSEQRAQERPR